MKRPKRVVIEFEDSTSEAIPFSRLGPQAQIELSSLALRQCENHPSYLLLQWQDGWKEVIAADERAAGLLRYYTVKRMEEVGRLSLEVPGSNPSLLLVNRLPGKLESILFVSKNGMHSHMLRQPLKMKEGGKIEKIFFDKEKNASSETSSGTSSVASGLFSSLSEALKKRGLCAASVVSKSEEERAVLYKEVAAALRLRATRHQQDVYGFLHKTLETLVTVQ
jgi:RNA-binding protein YhbY